MKRRTRVEITVEISQLVIPSGTYQTPVWCAKCLEPVQSIAAEDAAVLPGVNMNMIDCWVQAGHLHFVGGMNPASICLAHHSA